MEPIALEKYKQITQNQVFESGMIVRCDMCYLGASPDGLVKCGEEWLILEIKCPSSCKDKEIVVEYLEIGSRKGQQLKKSHPYYTQCQVLMYVCKVKKTHFFVFSSADYKLITVDYDHDFT